MFLSSQEVPEQHVTLSPAFQNPTCTKPLWQSPCFASHTTTRKISQHQRRLSESSNTSPPRTVATWGAPLQQLPLSFKFCRFLLRAFNFTPEPSSCQLRGLHAQHRELPACQQQPGRAQGKRGWTVATHLFALVALPRGGGTGDPGEATRSPKSQGSSRINKRRPRERGPLPKAGGAALARPPTPSPAPGRPPGPRPPAPHRGGLPGPRPKRDPAPAAAARVAPGEAEGGAGVSTAPSS